MTTFTVLIYILHANVFAQITPGTLDTPVFTQIAPAPPWTAYVSAFYAISLCVSSYYEQL